jgi:hypothetical protein
MAYPKIDIEKKTLCICKPRNIVYHKVSSRILRSNQVIET